MLECPLYNSIRDKFQSLVEKVVLGSLKSFFQLDHEVAINLYLTEVTTLYHFRELGGLTPSRCTFSPISLSAFWTLKSIPFHFIS